MTLPNLERKEKYRGIYEKYKNQDINYIYQIVNGWLFEYRDHREMDVNILGIKNKNGKRDYKGLESNHILLYLGLDKHWKKYFKENNISIEEAISELKNTEDQKYLDLIDILENILKIEEEESSDKSEPTPMSYKDMILEEENLEEEGDEELSFEDALENIREVLKKIDIDISDNDKYDAILVKKLKGDGVIDFNKPLTTNGHTSDIPFTTTQRNMFPYLRIEGFDDENKKHYLKNFFVLQIPVFLNFTNLIYLRDNFQEDGFRNCSKRTERLAEINNCLNELSSEEQTLDTHTTVFVKNKSRQKDQIGLSQTQTDEPKFTLLRKMLFEHDFLIILKRKLQFEYEIYCVKNKDGEFDTDLINNFISNESDKVHTPVLLNKFNQIKFSPNRIFFGAPGTGKSYTLNQQKDTIIIDDEYFERVTFHPDYSYANFVGTYKPIMKEDEESAKKYITYDFVPGPFLRVFVKAMKNKIEAEDDESKLCPFLLIIEEINRANVSAVFGDVFQLLDRDENNVSEYSINVSEDIKNHLIDKLNIELDDGFGKEDYEKYFPNNEIKIPNNMFIWATMNSADQGVFPIDTAFKRRWDFEYISINNKEELIENLKIESNEEIYNWNEVRKAINNYLLSEGINEDKLMGPFFIKENSYKDLTQVFKDKVLMYLYEDAAKHIRDRLFKGSKDELKSSFSYLDICNDFKDRGIQIFHTRIVNEIDTIIKKENNSVSPFENNPNEEER